MFAELHEMARRLGGEVVGADILCPGPGHSPQDRSLSIRLDPRAPGGLLVHSFAGQDALATKDYVRERLGLPRNAPPSSERRGCPQRAEAEGETMMRPGQLEPSPSGRKRAIRAARPLRPTSTVAALNCRRTRPGGPCGITPLAPSQARARPPWSALYGMWSPTSPGRSTARRSTAPVTKSRSADRIGSPSGP